MTEESNTSRSLDDDLAKLASCAKTQAALQRVARRILGDRPDAEDAIQGAYLAAWQRPPRRLSLAWMKRAVMSRAVDQRRRDAGRSATVLGLDEAGASGGEPASLVASIEAHRELGAALEKLPRAQGQALYLRYFEGLQPKAIARQLGLPLETVKSQLARGLQSLRKSLETPEDGGGLSTRGLALVALGASQRMTPVGLAPPELPTAGVPTAGIASPSLARLSVLTWLGSLSMKKWIAVALVLALSGLAGLRMLTPRGGPEPTVAAMPGAEEPDLVPVEDEPEPATLARARVEATLNEIPTQAEALPPAPPPLERSLEIVVTWSDGTPAAGTPIGIHLDRDNGQEQFLGEITVDREGRARLDDCAAGVYRVASGVRGEVELEAWDRGVATGSLTIPDGVDIHGTVADDEGQPIADAQLWVLTTLSGWQEHVAIGRTDSKGRFHLRDVPLYGAVGATAKGHAPSRWSPVSRMELTGTRASQDRAAELSMRLSKGGAGIRGAVTGPEGQPMRGALVAITTTVMGGPLDAVDLEPVQRYTTTDFDGAYGMDGLGIGTVQIACAADGLVRFDSEVRLAKGAVETLDIQLVRGGSVAGFVSNAAGEPMAAVTVGAFTEALHKGRLSAVGFSLDEPLGRPCATTNEDGSYRLFGVPEGEAFLYALAPEQFHASGISHHRLDEAQLNVVVGEEVIWNAMISAGRTIVGTLLYADHTPAQNITVAAVAESSEDMRFSSTSAEGSFRFENLDDDSFEVLTALPLIDGSLERVAASGVKPNGLPIELVAPTALALEPAPKAGTASVRGTLTDPHGRLTKWTGFILETAGGDDVKEIRSQGSNSFTFTGLQAGSYRLRVRTSSLQVLLSTGAFDVAEGESKDLGTLNLGPAGGQRFHFRRDPDWPNTSGFFVVKSADGTQVVADMFRATDEMLELDNLNPGRYTAHVYEGHLVGRGVEFDVTAGETGDTDFPFEVGVTVTVEVRFQPSLYLGKDGEPPTDVSVRAFSEDEDLLVDMKLSAMGFAAGKNAAGFCLPRGSVRIEASHPLAGNDSKTVVLESVGGEAPRVQLDLSR